MAGVNDGGWEYQRAKALEARGRLRRALDRWQFKAARAIARLGKHLARGPHQRELSRQAALSIEHQAALAREAGLELVRLEGEGAGYIYAHALASCEGPPCAVHAPSDHPLRGFRQHWRDDAGKMERLCPHGVGHPDPDDLAFKLAQSPDNAHFAIHGCDGCCGTAMESDARVREKLVSARG